MLLHLQEQYEIVVYGVLSGLFVGIFFDIYRNIRGENIPKFIMVVEDILFWIFSAIVTFVFLLISDYAILGVYIYLFMISGFYIYMKLFSKFMYKIENKIISSICSGIRILFNNIVYIFKIVFIRKKQIKK